jgi:8-oxo-dGTP pyrophosphatase MutT (NUDIX family)
MDKLNASGCVFLSIDTGRVLLQQRSGKSSHPRTWGFFGGKGEAGERPLETSECYPMLKKYTH